MCVQTLQKQTKKRFLKEPVKEEGGKTKAYYCYLELFLDLTQCLRSDYLVPSHLGTEKATIKTQSK